MIKSKKEKTYCTFAKATIMNYTLATAVQRGLVIFMKTAHFSWKTRNSDGVKVTRS